MNLLNITHTQSGGHICGYICGHIYRHISTGRHICGRVAALMAAAAVAFAASAFPTDTYSSSSVLSQGKWVKISVPESGVYCITTAQLSQWGFSDPSKVHVFGYGGARIPDKLSLANYVDDVPVVQSELTDGGIVFYAVGPGAWVKSETSYYHLENNIYTSYGYYFVSDVELPGEAPQIETQGLAEATSPATTFIDRLHYEVDSSSAGEAGYVLVGENLKTQTSKDVTFSVPGRVSDTDLWMECALVVKTFTSTNANFTVNGQRLDRNTSDKINAVSDSHYVHAGYTITTHKFKADASEVKVRVGIDDIASVKNAWLDYISLNYERELALPASGTLNFWSSTPQMQLAGAGADVRVWDVTVPTMVTRLNTGVSGSSLVWTNSNATSSSQRSYVAWNPKAKLPEPDYVSTLSAQNIHGMEPVDMIIITLPEYREASERLAELHRTQPNPLKVAVLNVEEIYNEFASGSGDVSALRRCLKMFYDRGAAAGTPLRYALLMGRSTYDNRHLTSQFAGASAYNTIPAWYGGSVKIQFSDNDAFGTDDFIAMLLDDTGTSLGIDDISVALGRIPVTSASEAGRIIDKIEKYMRQSVAGTWKNSYVFLADDGDSGVHLQQTEDCISGLQATPQQQSLVSKVYVNAYDIIGGVCEGGRKDLYRLLDEGAMWLNYSGHANNHSWTGEGILTFNDINNMYLKKQPILMAATCDFLRWDSQVLSGGEIMFFESNGGTIATISATRPVYISDNGLLSRAMGKAMALRDADGRMPRLGDIYRQAKNNILTDDGQHRSNANRLRYVLMGDPALEMAIPSNIMRLDRINGNPLDTEDQIVIKAFENVEFEGTVCDPQGNALTDFNGTMYVSLYDAERSITTTGEGKDNVQITFEQHGNMLYTGYAKVKDGKFTCTVSMPGEISDNFRPALINMYAVSDDATCEAIGINTGFYIYGMDETVPTDEVPPVIKSMVLNETSFKDGDDVNTSPLVIAEVSDDVGINLSSAGIGHQMTLTLDGRHTFTDLSLYYTPNADGEPGGLIAYPLEDLGTGEHTLTLRVWDTAANSASRTVNFNVVANLRPVIYKVYTDENPASTRANFYIQHNRPEAQVTASIMVFDLLGRRLWETTVTVPSDMYTSYPVSWDLTDESGHRVPRGIYLYRATLSTDDGETYDTAAQRLAVTAP